MSGKNDVINLGRMRKRLSQVMRVTSD